MKSRNMYRSMFAIIGALGLFLGCPRTRSDAEIASEIQSKINADSNIPTKQVTVGANNSVVTLAGMVYSDMERTAAANDASQVDGVKTVLNNLQVAPAAASAPARGFAPPLPRTRSARSAVVRPSAASVVTIPVGTPLAVRLIHS